MKKQKRVIKEDYLPQITLLLLDVCVVRLLFLFNSEFLMASLSFLVLLVLSYLLLLSSAEEEMEHPLKCPPPSHCEKPATFGSPLDNKTDPPECEFCTVMGCTQEIPLIQTEIQGKVFLVKNISESEAQVIQNDLFQMYSQSNMCESFNHSIFSGSSATSFKPGSTVTLLTRLNCGRIFHNGFIIGLTKKNEFWNCQDFVIRPNLPSHGPVPPPPDFSIIQFPVKMSLGISDLLPLLDLPRECHGCNSTGGQCQKGGKGNFWCLDGKRDGNRLKLGLGLGISGGGIIIILVSLFAIRLHYKRKYASSTFLPTNTNSVLDSVPELERMRSYYGIPIFAYSELEEATNNFDPSKEIGDGGFGIVYHGQLPDGREVAVKRLYENNHKRIEHFMNEVKILTRLRHPNLVALYGCTSRHSRELLLVYEFIPNGTIADHLHSDRANSGLLTWPVRLSIAIETASALCYLHASDIVHRDVKTSNILLDNSFCVKVADFGLSRLFPTDVSHISTAPRGTPGYVDPEYHQCYQLTGKSDVYSFGVVLIELISSLPAVDITRHRHEINLSNYAINKIQNCALDELVDPCLGFNSDLAVNRMTALVAELAFRCLQPDKDMRPSMDEVLETLKKIESDGYEFIELKSTATVAHSGGSLTPTPPPPPSPSPDCDRVGLLKSVQFIPSSNTVTTSSVHSTE